VEELGLEPGEELKALERRILAHDPSLDLARRGRTELPGSLTSFVGRRRELEQVQALLLRPGVRLLTLTGAGGMLDGDREGGESSCLESLTSPRAGEEWYRAVALNVLGTAERYRGRWEDARRRYDESLALSAAGDLWFPTALAQANLGTLAELQGRHADAVDHHERSVGIALAGGDAWMHAACLINTGRAVRQLGLLERASALNAEALRSFAEHENAWGIAVCLAAFAALAADRGQHVRAARLYGAEEAIRERGRVELWPTIRDEREAGSQATASALGEGAWERARSHGRGLTQADAVAEAYASAALPAPSQAG
jgi:tetratricopeptide (TPR) repeat protein